jgi:hypothetical protein
MTYAEILEVGLWWHDYSWSCVHTWWYDITVTTVTLNIILPLLFSWMPWWHHHY